MADRRDRSFFMPMLIVGVAMVSIVLFGILVPIRECERCRGRGRERPVPGKRAPECKTCVGRGNLPFLNLRAKE